MKQAAGIYLDYNATTPCDPRVVQAMLPYFSNIYGNPTNGLHMLGRKAARAIDSARKQVGTLIDAMPSEIIFTSGATESNHLAILGTTEFAPLDRRKIITCAIEHKAVLAPCKRLAEHGFKVVVLPVDSNGLVRLTNLEQAIRSDTFLISIQTANNEIGTIQPIAEIAELAHRYGALIHTDAAQAVGKIPCSVNEWKIDMLSLSSHKMYGPKGIGALYLRGGSRTIPLRPLFEGGGQEFGLRAGTPNVPSIIGFAKACEIAVEELQEEGVRLSKERDKLEQGLLKSIPNLRINALNAPRLPNTTNFTYEGQEADALLISLPDIMMSVGAACNTGAPEPSHVLQAIGLTREQASASVRISLGRMTNTVDIQKVIERITGALIQPQRS